MKWIRIFFFLFTYNVSLVAQTGGNNTFEFLNLTSSARVLALGDVLVNALDDDVNLAQQLPSLNHAGMNHQFSVNFTNYYAGIRFGSLVYGMPSEKFENVSFGLQYLNYGAFDRTDTYGNLTGTFSAGEYAFYASALIYKKSRFRFGSTIKGVYSNLESYNSFGLLADLSATYEVRKELVFASLLIKNMGFQLKTYAHESEPMPFEILLGVSSKLKHAPFRWSVTWSHIEKWDLSYINPEASSVDLMTNEEVQVASSTRDKILSHLHVGGAFLLGKNFNLRAGYNFRRRQELSLELFKHNVGLSWGFGVKVRKFQLNYARAFYHAAGPMHTFSVISNTANFKRK
ncbi:MAG: type IX secretion system protein PorQ [Flavobacteriales bacterium]|jgi:hypothetical protein|nr:type IX secretion system protein PorQ [Flavobacteriales bacterium]